MLLIEHLKKFVCFGVGFNLLCAWT